MWKQLGKYKLSQNNTLKFVSMSSKYNTEREYLEGELFKVVPPKAKDVHWPVINITILPDYLAFIKTLMTEEERILLSEFNVQTYLIENAFNFSPEKTFDELTQSILHDIRASNRFWVRKMGAEEDKLTRHHAIQEYNQDIQILQKETHNQKYPQSAFQLAQRKLIPDSYLYYGYETVKGAHKFTANSFSTVALYIVHNYMKADVTHSLDNEGAENCQTQNQKKLIFQLISNFAINSKPKQKKLYFGVVLPTQEEKQATTEGEQILEEFQEWYDRIDTGNERMFTSQKEYFLIANMLRIFRQFYKEKKVATISENKSEGEIPIEVEIMNKKQFQEIQGQCGNRIYLKSEITKVVEYLRRQFKIMIERVIKEREKKQIESEEKWKGFLSSEDQILQALEKYQEIMAHPENTNQTKYKVLGSQVPWNEEQYKKFLINFKKFFNVPTNNKKIAQSMGRDIEASHVKHVKGIYMRNMGNRIDSGEIGGGKKGAYDSKFNFLERDIESFNMKWFKKDVKSKAKKVKKRRKRPNFDGEEEDSDY